MTIVNKAMSDQRNGNLFIKLFGDFDKSCAFRLVEAIKDQYRGSGNVFVNTEKIDKIVPSGRSTFANLMQTCSLPQKNFFFIGKKGIEIGLEGSRVIVRNKKSSCGKCKKCSCKSRPSKLVPCSA